MTSRLCIVGCGGFGREVHDVVDAINAITSTWEMIGYIDDAPTESNLQLIDARGSQFLGDLHTALTLGPTQYAIGIGSTRARKAIADRLETAGWTAVALVHPRASVGRNVTIGSGSIVCAGARLTTNIALGKHVHININSTVGHDSRIGDFTSVNPLVAISGGVHIGPRTMIGTHAAILQNLAIGSDAIVGAGSIVTKDVQDGTTVKGVPAR